MSAKVKYGPPGRCYAPANLLRAAGEAVERARRAHASRQPRLAVVVRMETDGKLWRARASCRKRGAEEWESGPMLTSGMPPSEMAAEAVIAMVRAIQRGHPAPGGDGGESASRKEAR